MAVGDVIKEMGEQEISCHCECQELEYRFLIHVALDCKTVLVKDVGCRKQLLEVRSLDLGLSRQMRRDMLRHFEVDYRDVTYKADVNNVEETEALVDQLETLTDQLDDQHRPSQRLWYVASTWDEVRQWVDLATLRHVATYWS